MKTSRVNPTTSSIFRNSRQYLHANDQFYRVMHDGGRSYSSGQQQRKSSKNIKNNREKKNSVLKNSSGHLIVKGILMDGDSIMLTQKSLVEYSRKIKMSQNRISRIDTYRTSI
ncbi:hypothetical protein JOD29_003291 [Lysinibacillus composti]|uniref:Uncharacterized protein n=1 Tax=Lysinibacillus composti TaxID=720633 RepID=A0A3N9UA82_9BACI|nr:hypothetical protein [Lysinibacillus composti]MBM7610015.1 hypothetical protein [Lysinibacillus composti]RQW73428.1 hypothetical protein EBB45_16860 [Lysinibacillus composti]